MRATEARGGTMRPVADGALVAVSTECETTGEMTAFPSAADFCTKGSPGPLLLLGAPLSAERTGPRGRLAEARCCLCRTRGIPPGRWTPNREGPGTRGFPPESLIVAEPDVCTGKASVGMHDQIQVFQELN